MFDVVPYSEEEMKDFAEGAREVCKKLFRQRRGNEGLEL